MTKLNEIVRSLDCEVLKSYAPLPFHRVTCKHASFSRSFILINNSAMSWRKPNFLTTLILIKFLIKVLIYINIFFGSSYLNIYPYSSEGWQDWTADMNLSKKYFFFCHTFLIMLFGYIFANDNPSSFLGKFYSIIPAQNPCCLILNI